VVYFLFLSAFSDWEGGWSMGPRHLVPILPFLATAIVFQIGRSKGVIRQGLIWFLAVSSLIAITLTFIGTVSFPYFPKEFQNPLYDLSWQLLLGGKLAPTLGELCGLPGFYRLLPLIIPVGILMAILLRDLSHEIYREKLKRITFVFFSLAISVGILAAGLLGSRIWSGRQSQRDKALHSAQRTRVEAFMKREGE